MLRKVPLDELKPGMEVAEVSELWLHHPTLYTVPGMIKSQADIDRIRNAGYDFALVDMPNGPEPGQRPAESDMAVLAERADKRSRKPLVPLAQEVARAGKIYSRTRKVMEGLVESVRMGRSLDVEDARETVEETMGSLERNASAMNLLARLNRHDDYTYAHSVNVSVIALSFGHYLGLEHDELINVGLAGLFHDLGKLKLPGRIIRKKGKLTDEEFALMKTHPQLGYELLADRKDVSDEVKQAVRQHHERHNGHGYPFGLEGEKISLSGRMLALADVYDALTTERSYRQALMPGQAMSMLFEMRDADFRGLELELFIKCMGIYPPGGLVRLSSGETAVVLENNPASPLLPKVGLVLDKKNRAQPFKVVNLADQDDESRLSILSSVDPSQVNVDMSRMFYVKE